VAGGRRAFLRGSLALFALSLITPWGIFLPSEVTFLDFRLMTVSLVLLAAAIDTRHFTLRLASGALATACLPLTLHFGARAFAFGEEARAALNLVERAEPRSLLMTLTFNNVSAHFAKRFQLTHFLPMYCWQALVELGNVGPGHRVLIHAGAGGWAASPSSLNFLLPFVPDTALHEEPHVEVRDPDRP
jgi:hypothetical protein